MTISKRQIYMSQETRIALLVQSIGHINQTLIDITHKLDKIDEKIDSINAILSRKIDSVQNKLYFLIISVCGSFIGASIFLFAKLMRWI